MKSQLKILFFALSFFVAASAFATGPQCADLFLSAKSQKASGIYAEETPITLQNLKSAIIHLYRELKPKINPENEHSWNVTYNAFFKSMGEEPMPLPTALKELTLTPEQLKQSWREPLELSYLDMVLYKGHLFPSCYYLRRTWTGRGFNRYIPSDINNFGQQMPFAVIQGTKVRVNETGGSKRLLELWLEEHISGDRPVSLYRGTSVAEYKQQVYLQKLMASDLTARATAEDVQILASLKEQITDSFAVSVKWSIDSLIKEAPNLTRQQIVSQLLSVQGFGGLFTSFTYAGADGFKQEGGVVIKYQIPKAELENLVNQGQVFVGIEGNYFEIVFQDMPETNQRAKASVVHSLVDVKF